METASLIPVNEPALMSAFKVTFVWILFPPLKRAASKSIGAT